MIKLKKILPEDEINEFQVEGFDLDVFLKMNSFAAQVRYANKKLKRIAQGSARIVFEINDKTALKLAKNAKGIAQNEVEIRVSNNYMIPENIIAKVLEKDERDRWIVMELAKKISSGRFKQLMDGIDIKSFYYYIRQHTDRQAPQYWKINPEVEEKLNENEFAQDLVDAIVNFNLDSADFVRPSSFGEIDGRVVITDYGLTPEVYEKHYDSHRKYRNQH
jgi:hypothetical protein